MSDSGKIERVEIKLFDLNKLNHELHCSQKKVKELQEKLEEFSGLDSQGIRCQEDRIKTYKNAITNLETELTTFKSRHYNLMEANKREKDLLVKEVKDLKIILWDMQNPKKVEN